MSMRFKSDYSLDVIEYGIDLLNYLKIHTLDGKNEVDYCTAINLLVTGLINEIDSLKDRIEKLENHHES